LSKYSSAKYELLSVRWLKSGSFGFAKRWLVFRAKPNVSLVRWAKIVFKKVRWEKNKKHRVGFHAVLLEYCLYVFRSLSKWFVFVLMFKFWSVSCLWNGRPTIGYNGFALGEGGVRKH
jgi:hypothetical protein